MKKRSALYLPDEASPISIKPLFSQRFSTLIYEGSKAKPQLLEGDFEEDEKLPSIFAARKASLQSGQNKQVFISSLHSPKLASSDRIPNSAYETPQQQ